jgi:hypothetical protein
MPSDPKRAGPGFRTQTRTWRRSDSLLAFYAKLSHPQGLIQAHHLVNVSEHSISAISKYHSSHLEFVEEDL